MTRRRAPRAVYQRLADGTKNQRTLGAGFAVNAAPVPDHAAAVGQALASVFDVTDRASKIDLFTLAGDGPEDLTLTYLPVEESWNVSVNGVTAEQGTGYTVDGQTLSLLLTPPDAITGDKVQVQYDYLTGMPAAPNDEPPEGMLLWLRASDLGSVDNSDVTTWEDQSGNNNDGTGTGTAGAKPKLRTAQTPAGGNAVYIDSTSSARHISFADFLTGTTEAEAFVVMRAVSDPAPAHEGNANGFWKFGATTSTGSACHYPYDDGNIYDDFGSTSRQNVGNPTADLTEWHIYHVLTQANLWEARLDGELLYTSPGSVVGWSTTPVLGISEKSGALTETGQFYFAELLIYNTALTSDERTTVVEDLANRHGITL